MKPNSPETTNEKRVELEPSVLCHMAAVVAAGALGDHALDPEKAARVGLQVALAIHRQSCDVIRERERALAGGEIEGGAAAIPQSAG